VACFLKDLPAFPDREVDNFQEIDPFPIEEYELSEAVEPAVSLFLASGGRRAVEL